MVQCRNRVTAPRDRNELARAGQRRRNPCGGGGGGIKGRDLKGPQRAVPDQGLAGFKDPGQLGHRLGACVQYHLIRRAAVGLDGLAGSSRLELCRDDDIDRQMNGTARRLGLAEDVQRGRGHVALGQRFADLDALRHKEGVGHAAADHQMIDFGDQIAKQLQLG